MLPLIHYASIAILIIIFGLQVFRRPLLSTRTMRGICVVAILLVAALLMYYSYEQYRIWRINDLTRFFLPPFRGMGYFIFYVLGRFWSWYLASFVIGALMFFGMKFVNKKYSEKFFYPEEPYLVALSIFLAPHPLWIALIVFWILAHLAFSIIMRLFVRHESPRASLYYGWVPIAVAVLLLKMQLLAAPFLSILIFAKI